MKIIPMAAGLTVLAVIGSPLVTRAAPPTASAPPVATTVSDAYLQGYATAILENTFGLSAGSLGVSHGVITIAAADLPVADRERVVAALARIAGVVRVDVLESPVPAPDAARSARPAETPERARERGWETGPIPGGELFRPLIADPRWPHFSATYQRYLGDPDFKDVVAVSFGETFSVYRWGLPSGWLEASIQAGVFSIFDLDASSFDLVNADYLVAGAVGYRLDAFSAVGRVFHQSSHLGDEFLLRRSRVDRINLSYEGIDAKASYEFLDDVLRVYAGGGYLFEVDPPDLRRWSVQYGLELRSPWPGAGRRWRPIAAADVQQREENHWSADLSLRAGVQFGGVLMTRDMQLLLEYFNGNSPNGQFFRQKVDYLGLGVHFHF
jgi:uncharacterized protein DUF1207